MNILYKQASTLEFTIEYALDITFKQPNLKNTKLKQELTREELTRVSDADVAKAKKVLAQTTKMNNPFYYAAVKKRQNNPFQYRYDKMLNSLRRTYSADRFVSLLKVLSRSTLTERDDWLRGMENATR
jgi:hypothetical protein|tara:strand:+ start:4380 stop:4763 length:384 start_codon:yes stop_codon:yes gene_type:complete